MQEIGLVIFFWHDPGEIFLIRILNMFFTYFLNENSNNYKKGSTKRPKRVMY